jgi:hypothetical protein
VSGGDASSIGGELRSDGNVYMIDPVGVSFDDTVLGVTDVKPLPSLDELNIRAPAGAEVTIDADGVLTVRSSGDIYLEGPIPEIPGVTSIHIVTSGNLIAADDFELPSGVDLELDAGDAVEIPPGQVVAPIIPLLCSGLRPIYPAEETELGTFSMIASAADQVVEIDVLPWREPNRLRLGSRQLVPVALFGSENLDVIEVDRSSLRLGPGEGEPMARFGRSLVFRMDVNWDGHPDLLALFELRDLGIAFGDTRVCLSAATGGGATIEGCDDIETLPVWPRRVRRGRFTSSSNVFQRPR